MRKLSTLRVVVVVGALVFAFRPGMLPAGELGWGNLAGLVVKSPVDVPCPQSGDQCRKEFCIERVPVTECVKGKKRVYDCKVRREWVTIPETRYRWVTRCITEEIPCCYCKPVCKTKEGVRGYESEEWSEHPFQTCCGCGGIYCKHCQNKREKVECKYCGREAGETTIKVHYKSCVKQPYVVYRQVCKEICVKKPRFEHVTVPITRYVCKHCGGDGCRHCCDPGGCEQECCDDEGSQQCSPLSNPPLPEDSSAPLPEDSSARNLPDEITPEEGHSGTHRY